MSEVWYECKIRPDLKRFSFVNQYELFSHPSYIRSFPELVEFPVVSSIAAGRLSSKGSTSKRSTVYRVHVRDHH